MSGFQVGGDQGQGGGFQAGGNDGGFGAPAAATASTGFGAPSTAAMPVKNLGVVGGSKGSKKRVRLDE